MTDTPPRVIITGATGRTGNAVVHGLAARSDIELIAAVAPSLGDQPTRPLPAGIATFASLDDALSAHADVVDVLVDFTHAAAALHHLQCALHAQLDVVLGTTGIDETDLQRIGTQLGQSNHALLYVPNFSIGAVLAMRFAREAAAYFDNAEIIEIHHPGKRDAPSGTARLTAQMIAAARAERTSTNDTTLPDAGSMPSRGESIAGVPVHAVRMAGAVAHQQVMFGADGEVLTIRHDANDRSCYAAGVARAVHGVGALSGYLIGLEHVL